MTKASDNLFPGIIIRESADDGSDFSNPPADYRRLFVGEDGLFHLKDSAGTVTTPSSGVADQGSFTYFDATEAAAPSTPASGKVRLYAKADGLLYSKDDAGTESAVSGAGGGGSDLVQTSAGSGNVYVPGLRGSPDAMPASPSAFDDEFEALSGWTTLGALDTSNVSDFPSHWHAKRTNAGIALDGIYKTAPSMPFTVTAKLNASNLMASSAGTGSGASFHHIGILLTESSPGKCFTYGFTMNATNLYWVVYRWTNRTSFLNNIDQGPMIGSGYSNRWKYLRLVVASSTDVSGSVSEDGYLWFPTSSHQNVTTSLTVANVGLAIGDPAAAGTVEAVFDWIRFT